MKKVAYIAIFLLILLTSTAFASNGIRVLVNDKALDLDVPPTIVESRTLVPLRAIFEALDVNVGWNADTKAISGNSADIQLTMIVGNPSAVVNGKTVTMEVPAQIINGRTMVPVRFIAESIGAEVKWDPEKQEVGIIKLLETVQKEEQVLRLPHDGDFILDPVNITSLDDATIANNLYEGLLRVTDGKIVPAAASSYTVSSDGKIYTFHIRPEATWSDGSPLTAQDFVYSWKRALNPVTKSEYSFNLLYIEGAVDYNNGIGQAERVNVSALDDKTLQVVLSAPIPQFPKVITSWVAMPAHSKSVEMSPAAWWKNPQTSLSNGPFILKSFSPNEIVLVKNLNYWNARNVQLDKLVAVATGNATALDLYNAGKVDYASLDVDTNLQHRPDYKKLSYAGTQYYAFNTNNLALCDPKVRKALSLVIDRASIITDIGALSPASSFVGPGVPSSTGKDFVSQRAIGATNLNRKDINEAKKLLAEAGYPDGKDIPALKLVYNTSPSLQTMSEHIQSDIQEGLGIDVEVIGLSWNEMIEARSTGAFDLMRFGWIGDYEDPMTFLDLWTSYAGDNYSGWSSAAYDALIDQCNATLPGTKRDDLLHQAEELLIENYVMIPIYHHTEPTLIRSTIRRYQHSSLGYWYFGDAYFQN